ncbi:sensor histidine kinase [Streptomyces triticagri]|uniref:histidine kinase n=1 Tax=Streptomyces triticagri TaxID=2293568 RepID=A0A372LVD2_9ACTN|nr:sensor histidine kinase [Streptomyces triticagri]RFU82509.1 sensor histidine kinase [Streptomyces triticagri]
MDTTRPSAGSVPRSSSGTGTAPAPLSSGPVGFRRSLVLWGLSCRAFWLSLWLFFVYLTLSGPLGLKLMPSAVRRVRSLADRQRALAAEWSGVEIPAAYPEIPASADQGRALRTKLVDKDNQIARDWRWVTLDPIVGGAISFGPLLLVLSGIWGLTTAVFGAQLSDSWDSIWYLFIPVDGVGTAILAGLLGAVQFPLAFFWAGPRAVRQHSRYLRAFLAPSDAELMAGRIEHLTATRSDAVDTQMAEIRRIERDLHDGAQARLVAMGMTLDAAEQLLESNPDAVRALLVEARQSSNKALAELRDLVRGIHPPVLADRGLGDAVRSLAMISQLRTEVEVDLPARPEPPVESAAYFAVSEILANAAKHSGAERCWIDIRHEAGMLRITVTDNGRGGADITAGTGLRGIERRLATFDGVLAVSSPLNGPTMVTMELPCALSSPKTTSS